MTKKYKKYRDKQQDHLAYKNDAKDKAALWLMERKKVIDQQLDTPEKRAEFKKIKK